MIDITRLKKEDVGRWVLYEPAHRTSEKGKIKSWNEHWIFVVYHCAGDWKNFQDYTGAATSPTELRFTSAEEKI
jgi:hypothetical protein